MSGVLCHFWRSLSTAHNRLSRLQQRSVVFTKVTASISKKHYKWPEIDEKDLEETFQTGGGPGGQAVARTNNCVLLKHLPTGIVIRAHDTRSQAENRKIARERLQYHLDIHVNGENSFDAINKREKLKVQEKRKKQAKKLLELKIAFKEREGVRRDMGDQKESSYGFVIVRDWFGGLEIRTKDQTFDSAEEYDERLKDAIPRWESEGVRGFWARIALQHCHITAVFAKYGLDFHHAQPGYVMMSTWLSKAEPSMIPEYANHYLGVAGFVVNNQNQVLVIKEKYHPLTKVAPWKFPGGMADKNESIEEAAKREVFEETGIEAEFQGIITLRHQTKFRYNCSDFYFICLMKPSKEDQPIKKCQQEIAECKWMDIDDYLADPEITDANRFFTQSYKDSVEKGNLIFAQSLVPSYNRKTNHACFSIQTFKSLEDSGLD